MQRNPSYNVDKRPQNVRDRSLVNKLEKSMKERSKEASVQSLKSNVRTIIDTKEQA